MKSTICPDCEGDEFHPCAICYKAMTPDNIDTMTDDEVKSELDLRGINFLTSYHKMQTALLDRVQDRLKQRDEESKRLHEDIARLELIIRGDESHPSVIGDLYRASAPGQFGPSEWLDLMLAVQDGRCTCMRAKEIIEREIDARPENRTKHDYWTVGDPECPKEIKAGNGELHTLQCKRCGQRPGSGATESCHPAAEAYAKRHEMDVILSGHVDHESITPDESELSYWKHRCRIFEVLNRASDADLVEMKEKVARLEERLMLSDYHKEAKGVF